jgi:hypothetical protein
MPYPSPSSAPMENFVHDPSDGTDAIEKELELPSLNPPPTEPLAQVAKRAMNRRFSSLPARRGRVDSLVGGEGRWEGWHAPVKEGAWYDGRYSHHPRQRGAKMGAYGFAPA